jgi:hypothetical protein
VRAVVAAAVLVLLPATSPIAVGRNVNVSRAPLPQSEVRAAVDPSNPAVLLAGSNSNGEGAMRVYGSTDGGATWTSDPLPSPPAPGTRCAADPAVAIDRHGRQYFLWIGADPCFPPSASLFFAARQSATAAWALAPAPIVPQLTGGSFDDNPWLAVDTSPASPYADRLYVAWLRYGRAGELGLMLVHSDDHGATWSSPVRVNDTGRSDGYPVIALAPDGDLYVAWHDFGHRLIKLDRSHDGGTTFGTDRSFRLRVRDEAGCPNGVSIPAQPLRCVRSNPNLVVTGNRVLVSYGDSARNGSQDVLVARYDRGLRRPRTFARRVGARERRPSDQFWPAATLDPATGLVWLCFYDTRGASRRMRAWFSCTYSHDGREWAPVRKVASAPSNERAPGADEGEYGDYESVVAAAGIAHPVWSDSRDLARRGEEIYTARVAARPRTGAGRSG